MAGGVMHVKWYATLFRGDLFADAVAEASELALRYGASRINVQRSRDDAYNILQMSWFESKDDWYRYWDGPEMIEFRARYMGKYQVPISYTWYEELAYGELGPQVGRKAATPAPAPESEPSAV
jgi:hypothetical protein